MKRRSLAPYQYGLIVAIVMSLGIFAAVLYQAQLNRQDYQRQTAADNIESKLSSYAYDKQLVPESLAAAGIKNVPSYITYKKLKKDSYQFCVTYKGSNLGAYKAGKNCHSPTIYLTPPPSFVKNADGTYTVCGQQAGFFGLEGYIMSPTLNTPNVLNISNQMYTFSAESKAYDENCNELTQADLHIGDKVDVFSRLAPPNSSNPAISTYLKRS